MGIEHIIMRAVKTEPGYLTPAKLASRLDVDLGTIQKSLHRLEKKREIETATLEKLLLMGK